MSSLHSASTLSSPFPAQGWLLAPQQLLRSHLCPSWPNPALLSPGPSGGQGPSWIQPGEDAELRFGVRAGSALSGPHGFGFGCSLGELAGGSQLLEHRAGHPKGCPCSSPISAQERQRCLPLPPSSLGTAPCSLPLSLPPVRTKPMTPLHLQGLGQIPGH